MRAGESFVVACLVGTSLAAAGFVAVYVVSGDTQLLGLSLGLALGLLATALITASKRVVRQEQHEEERGAVVHEEEERETAQLVREGGSGISRRKLLVAAAGAAGTALTAALVVPAASLGPFLGTDRLLRTPWRAGRRLVDARDRLILADDVSEGVFVTAFPEGAPKDTLDAPLIVIRLPLRMLKLPEEREGWAPEGVLAFSKICPHAACAISIYRWPLFEPTSPEPALVCPCHYSTFEPATGGELVFGPAGRPLPQLPLAIGAGGVLEAAGPFSGAVGPSWWGVRMEP